MTPTDPAIHPADPRLFVPERLGAGWTVNLAHPHARTVLVFLFLALLIS